jgi:CheY-like chemotaxis protein
MSRILVTEDDDAYRKVLRTVLHRAGYEVVEARDGTEAVAYVRRESPDLIVTDILMPGCDGIETMMAVRQLRPGMRVIAISGGGRIHPADFLHMASKLGARRTLAKPFSNAQFLETVAEVLAEP